MSVVKERPCHRAARTYADLALMLRRVRLAVAHVRFRCRGEWFPLNDRYLSALVATPWTN